MLDSLRGGRKNKESFYYFRFDIPTLHLILQGYYLFSFTINFLIVISSHWKKKRRTHSLIDLRMFELARRIIKTL